MQGTQPLFCIHCGAPVPFSARYCPACGGAVGTVSPFAAMQAPAAPAYTKPRRNTVPIVIAIVVAVALIGFGMYKAGAPLSIPLYRPAPVALTQKQTVERFYQELNARHFQTAFSLIGPSWRRQLVYSKWTNDFATTLSQRATVSRGGDGRYDVQLIASDSSEAGPITTVFDGSWKVVGDGHGGWKLDDPSFSKVTSSYFAEKPTGSISDTYAKIKPSLAIVVSDSYDGPTVGTAFCVGSNEHTSYFLTNHHVVGDNDTVTVAVPARSDKPMTARVIAVAQDTDAALIAIDVGALPVLPLADEIPKEGRHIGIAGFPAIQLELALERLGLSPSLHEGSVNAIVGEQQYIEYDAQTDHGNSGGPLFDAATGRVYGLVTYGVQSPVSSAVQANLAIPVSDLRGFLTSAQVDGSNALGFGI